MIIFFDLESLILLLSLWEVISVYHGYRKLNPNKWLVYVYLICTVFEKEWLEIRSITRISHGTIGFAITFLFITNTTTANLYLMRSLNNMQWGQNIRAQCLKSLCTFHHRTSPRLWRRGQQARRVQQMPPRPISHRWWGLFLVYIVFIKNSKSKIRYLIVSGRKRKNKTFILDIETIWLDVKKKKKIEKWTVAPPKKADLKWVS